MAFNKQQKISSYLSNNESSPNNASAIQPNIFNPLQPLMGQATKGMFELFIFSFFLFPTQKNINRAMHDWVGQQADRNHAGHCQPLTKWCPTIFN